MSDTNGTATHAEASAPAAHAPAAGKGKGPIVLAALVLVPAILGAGAARLVAAPPAHEKAETKEPATASVVELPELVVNLADGHGTRYLKLRVAIELKAPDAEAGKAALAAATIPIRDALIGILSSKTLELVLAPESRDAIRKEILEAVNRAGFSSGSVTATRVFFLEFIVQ